VLKSALNRLQPNHEKLAVLMIDLDDFKAVNDTLGHDAGDQLLIELSQRFKTTLREGDFLCRLGGDEFVVLAKNLESEQHAAILGDRLLSVLRKPVCISGTELIISASIGIAASGEFAEKNPDLLKYADVAMYRAKQEGRNQYRFFSERLHDLVMHRARIKHDLHQAVARGEMRVFYQAQIRSEDLSLGGMEALVRWEHPTLGLLSPFDFLAIAEETGFITEIGNWVLIEACQTLADWRRRFPEQCENITLAVNLSASQIKEVDLIHFVKSVLKDNGLESHCLELEITENAFIAETIEAIIALSRLGLEGVKLALDDFGTGYSSIQHLKMFAITTLKIDKIFIDAIANSDVDDRLLIALIRFAKLLDLKVVAEGVETPEQAKFCTQHGCDLLQGYFYSRPISKQEFEKRFLFN
jgi:diguanylate cyclase (GGDEF)-like protein